MALTAQMVRRDPVVLVALVALVALAALLTAEHTGTTVVLEKLEKAWTLSSLVSAAFAWALQFDLRSADPRYPKREQRNQNPTAWRRLSLVLGTYRRVRVAP